MSVRLVLCGGRSRPPRLSSAFESNDFLHERRMIFFLVGFLTRPTALSVKNEFIKEAMSWDRTVFRNRQLVPYGSRPKKKTHRQAFDVALSRVPLMSRNSVRTIPSSFGENLLQRCPTSSAAREEELGKTTLDETRWCSLKKGSVKEMKYLSRIIQLVVASAVCFFTFFSLQAAKWNLKKTDFTVLS